MSLQEEQSKRLAKIRALLAKAEDEAVPAPEAELLTLKAAELMSKHSIDQAMLDAVTVVLKPAMVGRRTISFAGQDFVSHRQSLLHVVALHHMCTTVVTEIRIANPQSYVFGYESDLDLTEMLYTSLILQAHNALVAEDVPFGESPRSFATAWWTGYVGRISTRLASSRLRTEYDAEKSKPGTALVLKSRKAEVERAEKEAFPGSTKVSRGKGGRSRAGRAAGYAAGSQANLGNAPGISGGSASRALEG